MSKKWKKHDSEAEELFGEEKKFKAKKRKFRAKCAHTKPNGKTHLKETRQHAVYECERCHKKVDYNPYLGENKEDGREKLQESVDYVSNALDIIKVRAARDGDNDRSEKIIDFCAELQLNLESVPDIMESLDEKSEKERKHEKHRDIKVGLDSLAFGKKKKNKGGW